MNRRPALANFKGAPIPKKITVREFYRGHKIEAELFDMPAARQAIDRLWSSRIAEAKDAAGRWEVLKNELRLIEKTKRSRTGAG